MVEVCSGVRHHQTGSGAASGDAVSRSVDARAERAEPVCSVRHRHDIMANVDVLYSLEPDGRQRFDINSRRISVPRRREAVDVGNGSFPIYWAYC